MSQEHECDDEGQSDIGLCGDCKEHAGFCSQCGISNCCGAGSDDLAYRIDLAIDRMKYGDDA